ncbi:MAG: agmatine deiminase family protein [Bacteroidales bacterium]
MSDKLESGFPGFYTQFTTLLKEIGIPFDILHGTADIWIRDYMPVQISNKSFILFHYDPKYLYDVGLEHTITDAEPLLRNLSFSYKKLNEICLDGGNVVKSERKAITTDFLCKYNPGFRRSDLRKLLLSELRAEKIIIIPHEPYDYTGHADGMVRFLDESHVLVNDYKGYNSTISDRLIKTLNANKLIPVAFPYHPSEKLNKAGDYTAIGNYMNFLWVGNMVVLPEFRLKDEAQHLTTARKILEPLGLNVYTVDAREIAEQGGVLNCVTWGVKV